ncbi:MAG: pseudouridine synthase [Saprospiraceae bacterium]
MSGKNSDSVSLNKYISNTGKCSRREADLWIQAGRIRINGKVAKKGNRVNKEDDVSIDGKKIKKIIREKGIYLLVHKAPGITCTTEKSDPDNIIDYVNYPKRIFPIGRLDKASSGLILMTNDGDIVNLILRSDNNHEKEYIVTVHKALSQQFINGMKNGVPILGKRTKKCVVHSVGKQTFRIVLTEGMNRQIRRMCEHFGYKVLSLKRVRVMNIELGDLKVNHWRILTNEERNGLFNNLK